MTQPYVPEAPAMQLFTARELTDTFGPKVNHELAQERARTTAWMEATQSYIENVRIRIEEALHSPETLRHHLKCKHFLLRASLREYRQPWRSVFWLRGARAKALFALRLSHVRGLIAQQREQDNQRFSENTRKVYRLGLGPRPRAEAPSPHLQVWSELLRWASEHPTGSILVPLYEVRWAEALPEPPTAVSHLHEDVSG